MSVLISASAHAQRLAATSSYVVLGPTVATPAPLAVLLDIAVDSVRRIDAVRDVARRAKVGLTFDRLLPGLSSPVSLYATQISAAAALCALLDGSEIDAMAGPTGHIVLVRHRSTDGDVRGVVLDSAGAPVAAARVEIVGTMLGASTTADGAFVVSHVPLGEQTVRVRRLGYAPVSVPAQVADGMAPLVLTLDVTAMPLSAIIVSPSHFGLLNEQAGTRQTLSQEQIRTRPQLGDDLFRSINRLPGLSSDDFAAGFHVRGKDIDATYVSLDGAQLIEPFHLKDLEGALSILDVQAVGGIDLTTGGYSAEYGGRLGGVLAIRSASSVDDGVRTTAGLSVTNARLQSAGAFGNGRGNWLVSARRGYVDLALHLAGISDSLSPTYSDIFAKVSWQAGVGQWVTLHVLNASDQLTYTSDGGEIRSKYGSHYAWLTWEADPSDRLSGRTVITGSALSWLRGGAPTPLDLKGDTLHDHRSFGDLGARADWSYATSERVLLRWGGEAKSSTAKYDYAGLHYSREFQHDSSAVVPRSVLANLSADGTTLGAYVSPRIRLADWLTGEAGLRYDRVTYTGDALVSPRASAAASLGPTTTLHVAVGRYNQPQGIHALQVSDGITSFARADLMNQRLIGIDQRVGAELSFRLEAYDETFIRERPTYINVRESSYIFPEFSLDRLLLQPQGGHAHGIEALAQRHVDEGLEWSASYAFASSTDRVAGVDVPRIFDQRHTAYVDASYRPAGGTWRFSAAWQFHSGWPGTPESFVVDTTHAGAHPGIYLMSQYGPLTRLGEARLGWYHRTDVRLTRDIQTSHGVVSFFFDVFNLFNNFNTRNEVLALSNINGRITARREANTQVSRLPTAGISWSF